MGASHVPAGHCRTCGYAMDPGRCPECGTVCPNVAPRPSVWPGVALAVGIGVTPVVWACATYSLGQFVYRQLTVGLIPGDRRFNDAWDTAFGWSIPGYFIILPLLILVLVALLVRRERRRERQARVIVALGAGSLGLAVAGWVVGLVGLATTIWNE